MNQAGSRATMLVSRRLAGVAPIPPTYRSFSSGRVFFNKKEEKEVPKEGNKDDNNGDEESLPSSSSSSSKSPDASSEDPGFLSSHRGTAPAEQGPRGYIPRMSYERVSYEYPPSPMENSSGQRRTADGRIKIPSPVESSAWRRHLPVAAAVIGIVWAVYAYKYLLSGEKTSEEHTLEPDQFTTFKITYKEDIAPDVQLIELSPRNYEQYRKAVKSKGSLWNGKNLWSVEIKQPEIQVVRRYTPLPLYFMQGGLGSTTKEGESGELVKTPAPALLRMLGEDEDEGRFVLLVKKYNDGEVSRWLNRLPVGTLIDVRGPFVGYKYPFSPIDKELPPRPTMEDLPSRMKPEDFPDENTTLVPIEDDKDYDLAVDTSSPKGGFWSSLTGSKKGNAEGSIKKKRVAVTQTGREVPLPENIAFFAGGTGITPILQSLLSKNPPRGFVDVYYSVRDRREVPFSRFLLFLEKAGRAKFHIFVDEENKFLTEKECPEPGPLQYKGYTQSKKLEEELEKKKRLEEAIAAVKREKQQMKDGGPSPRELPALTGSDSISRGAEAETQHPTSVSVSVPDSKTSSVPGYEDTISAAALSSGAVRDSGRESEVSRNSGATIATSPTTLEITAATTTTTTKGISEQIGEIRAADPSPSTISSTDIATTTTKNNSPSTINSEPESQTLISSTTAQTRTETLRHYENPRIKYRSILDQVADRKEKVDETSSSQKPSLAIVCGPPGYVSYMAGRRDPRGTNPITGILGKKGWNTSNTVRME